jgi:DNA recombination protein RmuC
MQTLATGVGDLKRVLTNVKTRGTWGEVQLEALLEQLLTAEQYAKNVATRPNSLDRVEFAIRLPGLARRGRAAAGVAADRRQVPARGLSAPARGAGASDPAALELAIKALEGRLRDEARKIRDKYVEPPYTTDFAILYLPTEGLYAEACGDPGWLTPAA